MPHPSPARWLAVFLFLPSAAPAAAAPEQPLSVHPYRSAFDGYRGHADEKPVAWQDANDTVRRRGGWRAYAEEAAPPPAPGTGAPAPAGAASPHRHIHAPMPTPSAEGRP